MKLHKKMENGDYDLVSYARKGWGKRRTIGSSSHYRFSTMESRLFVRYHFIDRQIVSFYYQMYLPGFYLDIQGVCWVTATYPRRPPSGSMRR